MTEDTTPDPEQEAHDEIGRWGGEFIAVIDAIAEGEPQDVVVQRMLGDPDQEPGELSYRLRMMLLVGSWVAGALLKRAQPDIDGSGFFGLDIPDGAHPSQRVAAQLVVAGANRDDDQTRELIEVQAKRGDQAMSEALGALTSIAAPMWDRKPVDL